QPLYMFAAKMHPTRVAELPSTPQELIKDKDRKRLVEPGVPQEREVVEDPMAAAAFFVPVEPDQQEVVRIPAKSRHQPSQVVSVQSVKILAAAQAPVFATSQKTPAPDRKHTKVDLIKNPHKKLKSNVWVQHVQKLWGDPTAHQGKRGESIAGASSGPLPPDPYDFDGQVGKKARREWSEQFSTSRESSEIYERVPSLVVRAQTQQEMDAQAAIQESVSGWLWGQPRD
ncbi:MAG: hypothetical protein GY835_28195, partial [bacterium]|nr:hypothetical protein [bacterium]